jgi:lipopolysaccharide export system protein LptC
MKEYIGEIIGAVAVIIAAVIGLFARNKRRNKQIVNNSKNNTIYQANGTITVGDTKDKNE